MGGDGTVEPDPELALVELQIGGGERILRREAAVEAWLGDAGMAHDLVDADGADALAVEQVAGGAEDPVGGTLRLAAAVACRTFLFVAHHVRAS